MRALPPLRPSPLHPPADALRTLSAFCLVLAVCLLLAVPAAAQPRNVRIDQPQSNAEEVSIAINPVNPDNIIAGANLRYVFSSFDGGKTWEQRQLPNNTYGDPCVTFDADGRAYYAHLTVGWDAITVRTSDDGGRTWSAGVKLRGPSSDSARPGSLFRSSLQDKEWMVTDRTRSPFRGSVYVAWTDFTKYGSMDPKDSSVIVFARSTTRGESFEPFVRVSDVAGNAVDGDNTMEGAVPAVGPGGEVYLAWAGPAGIYFDRSFDGGRTWGRDAVISDMPGGWDIDISGLSRANGLPVTVADISQSAQRGTVYVNWVDARHGDHDVFILRSTDHGDTWEGPIRVNDDPVGNGREQFFTWAIVDPMTGELSIVYYDRSAYATDSTDVVLARSTDGGRTFTRERISTSAFVPTPFVFFGDYNGIAAHDGRIRPIWTRLNDGELSIHTALIDPPVSPVEPTTPLEGGLQLRAWPNPMDRATARESTVEISMQTAGRVRLTVHDLIGRTVATLHEGWMERGAHALQLHADALPTGTYIVRLQASERDHRRDVVLTRLFTLLR